MAFKPGDVVIILRPKHNHSFTGYWGIVQDSSHTNSIAILLMGLDAAYTGTSEGHYLIESGKSRANTVNFYSESLDLYQPTNRRMSGSLKKD